MPGVSLALAAHRFPPLSRDSIGAVVFDMDGLLLDSQRLDRRLWQTAAIRHGLSLPDHLHAALLGRREDECMTLLGAHHIPKAIATSTGRTEASQSLGPLAARLEVIACGEEVPQGKAAPDVYLRADALLEVAPGRCLALEDSINGRRAASDAGMIVVMIPDLRDAPADETYLCESLNVSAAEIASALACGPGDNSSCDRNISQ